MSQVRVAIHKLGFIKSATQCRLLNMADSNFRPRSYEARSEIPRCGQRAPGRGKPYSDQTGDPRPLPVSAATSCANAIGLGS